MAASRTDLGYTAEVVLRELVRRHEISQVIEQAFEITGDKLDVVRCSSVHEHAWAALGDGTEMSPHWRRRVTQAALALGWGPVWTRENIPYFRKLRAR